MTRPNYEALDAHGRPYLRPARLVGELPTAEARAIALQSATQVASQILGIKAVRRIPFGGPVFIAFGLSKPEAKKHAQSKLLLTIGESLSLDYYATNGG